jgi:hypothetical protein
MADPERLELPTPAFEAQCSIQLSYGSALGLENKRIRSGPPMSRLQFGLANFAPLDFHRRARTGQTGHLPAMLGSKYVLSRCRFDHGASAAGSA